MMYVYEYTAFTELCYYISDKRMCCTKKHLYITHIRKRVIIIKKIYFIQAFKILLPALLLNAAASPIWNV